MRQTPPLLFEQENRLSGIAGHYHFPTKKGFSRAALQRKMFGYMGSGNLTEAFPEQISLFGKTIGKPDITAEEIHGNEKRHTAFYRYVMESRHACLMEMYTALKKLNPEIGKIIFNPDSTNMLDNVVHGIISEFNVDDIKFYLASEHSDRTHLPDAVKRQHLFREIGRRLDPKNIGIDWIVSTATLEKVWQQVKKRPILEASRDRW